MILSKQRRLYAHVPHSLMVRENGKLGGCLVPRLDYPFSGSADDEPHGETGSDMGLIQTGNFLAEGSKSIKRCKFMIAHL